MTRSTSHKLDQLFSRLALAIAAVVVFTLPVVSGFIAYHDLAKELTFKARIKADAQKELVTTRPETWMFAENQMQGILLREPVLLDNEFIQIFDIQGNELTAVGNVLQGFLITRSYPLYDISQIVGKVVVSSNLTNIVHKVLVSGIIGLLLGGLVLAVLWLLPMKQLRKLSGKLFAEKQLAEVTLQSVHDGVLRTDNKGDLVYLNSAAEKLIGSSFSELNGKSVSEVLTLIEDQTNSKVESTLYQAIHTKKQVSCDNNRSLVCRDNRTIAVEEQAVPLLDQDGQLTGGVLCLSDVSVFREQLKQQVWEASHDALTGLINRREFEKRVAKAIERARVDGKSGLLFFMDLDGFKIVNDTCGHAAGDDLLVQLSQVIGTQVRASDSLARLGGDEFGLLLEGCDEEHGQIIGKNILGSVKEYFFYFDGKSYSVGVSIGMTSFSKTSGKAVEVIKEADTACYWAKESGRHQLCVFQESESELTIRRDEVTWVERIKSALKENRFLLYHQTYKALSSQTGPQQHMEILLRMVSREGEIILPGRFLPAAERYNLMPQIDRWVINKVFSEFHTIQNSHPDSGLMININLSGASINAVGLYDFIRAKVDEYRIDTSSICFEITETVAVRSLRSAIEFIEQCKEIGIQFAIDDFGTGASFFSYLKSMPVDYLKIDGSFVRNVEQDKVNRAMIETINHIGHLLGKKTVAEFAENQNIIEILNDIGVDFAQGYGVCKPIPLIEA
ncbi:MAG: GGDEF domain-containing protein [Gammaproteobacteria bacterium]|nr:MAG: GGDEF domain-containing protein [Pseudomonadota bacterium]PIE38015.1 MAG: GGDEF domain-containing protein [Gammaproteobacteria bacterium]